MNYPHKHLKLLLKSPLISKAYVALFVGIIAIFNLAAQAEIQVANIFSDGMVFQRGCENPVWGWGSPGEKVEVVFMKESVSATVDEFGCWKVLLKSREAQSQAQELQVNDTLIKDVLVGEVWLASGGKGMDLPMRMCANNREDLKTIDNPLVRFASVGKAQSPLPEKNVPVSWSHCNKAGATNFSGTCVYFAKELAAKLGVPVGVIKASVGGTPLVPWIPAEGFKETPGLQFAVKDLYNSRPSTEMGKKRWKQYLAELEAWYPRALEAVNKGEIPKDRPEEPNDLWVTNIVPTKTFNGMINPLIPYSIKGFLWDHSEILERKASSLYPCQKALIHYWRKLWGREDLSFYMVQAHPIKGKTDPAGDKGIPLMRDLQQKCLEIPHTGLVVVSDLGIAKNRFENHRKDVGQRLANWALAKDYGKDQAFSGPLYKEIKVENKTIRVTFHYAENGLMVGDKKNMASVKESSSSLEGFSVAGQDKVWHHAKAEIDATTSTVVVRCDAVSKPVAVRYAYRNNPEKANLYNKDGLPASSFRSDSWDLK
ncbi:MAG: hypothetical protein HQL32_03255 [Planctomycetes bacterium]|nr:hypothetical protein [Planctomycetota bacterium]